MVVCVGACLQIGMDCKRCRCCANPQVTKSEITRWDSEIGHSNHTLESRLDTARFELDLSCSCGGQIAPFADYMEWKEAAGMVRRIRSHKSELTGVHVVLYEGEDVSLLDSSLDQLRDKLAFRRINSCCLNQTFICWYRRSLCMHV